MNLAVDTKFQTGNTVWIEHKGMRCKAMIVLIRSIKNGEGESTPQYVFRHAGREVTKREDQVFKTEKQLLNNK
jgi:hypothetical protein